MMRPLASRPKLIRQRPVKHDTLRRLTELRRVSPVTVCIAARSGGTIFGVSDRMLTSGDIEFEPLATTKLTPVTNSIAVMASGDAAFNTEIVGQMSRVVAERIASEPNNWWTVRDVSDLYIKFRNEAKKQRAEAALLAPLGLSIDTYRDELRKLDHRHQQDLLQDLIDFDVPHTSVILAGVDVAGPHIYVVHDGVISCNDVVGFAAVGIGARHAESQFMSAQHTWNSPQVDTALLAYLAKKRSEIAPGVGDKGTDMFTVGPGLGTLTLMPDTTVDAFEAIYQRLRIKESDGLNEARREANEFVTAAAAKAADSGGDQKSTTTTGVTE